MAVKHKISKVKRNNQKRGKLLKKGIIQRGEHSLNSKKTFKGTKKNVPSKMLQSPEPKESEESDNGEDMLEMVEKDDLDFLKNAITNRSYNIFKSIQYTGPPKHKKRKLDDNEESLEKEYEDQQEETPNLKVRNLLPIKTKEGFVPQQVVMEAVDQESEDEEAEKDTQKDEDAESEDNDGEFTLVDTINTELDISKPLSAAQLLAHRNKVLTQRKLEIGILSSQVLENPDEKMSNLRILLKIMDEQTPEVYLTVRKLATVSLLEVFKDVIPSYKIRSHKDEGVLLKKTTLKLRKFETELLQHYKKFLQKLEKACLVLQKKKGYTNNLSKEGKLLGELALHTMCDLLVTHPYFNFSENIAQVVVPFLNHRDAAMREIVKSAVTTIFKEDKKEEITLKILRIINHYLKTKAHNVRVEMLEVLLVLKLKDVNLEQEKELDLKQKKLMSKKQNVLQLSKKERKRKKQLKHLENELLETKAEENKQAKQKNLTEITKIVFGIYFRILKSSTNNKAVGVCLEGLAKYAHCINLDYYVDIVNLLDTLLKEEWLGFREQLHCIQTVFAILSGQGEALSLDPTRFYNNLYKNLLHISAASKMHNHQLIVLQILGDSCIKRRKKITNKRMIGFTKRLAILCLQLLHHGTLGTLGVIRNIMQMNKAVDILLDTDNSVGNGNYMPELDDPEYSNASSTALYEMILLHKHYHPVVSKFAKNIASGVPSSGDGILAPELGKLHPEDLFQNYDMTDMAFNPPVPVPKKVQPKTKTKYNTNLVDSAFENYCKFQMKTQLKKGIFCIE